MRIVVIGGAGGIGSALARKLAAKGIELLLCGRTQDTLSEIASATGAATRVVDARDPDAVETVVASFGPIDGLVNCAGSILLKPAHLTTAAEWRETMETNLTTAYGAVRAAVKAMSTTGGSIVLCSTAAARTGLPNHEAIAAAKAGVIGLTLSAAATYGPRNIRVNCVAPGLVDTPLASRITSNTAALNMSKAMHALGRIGRPEEVAGVIAWLLDPENSWITGQVIGVDGGLGTVRSKG
ncbi:MAG: SDR family oxidoreductase [Bryobacterales bacterium]|nr:SDR family oxidoreductase [Bryobacterales bacterium]